MSGSGFTRFKRSGGPDSDAPTVTIQPNGCLRISLALLAQLGNPTHVALLYNRERALVALEPTTPDDPDGYAVRAQRRSRVVSAAAFLRRVGREAAEHKGRYPARIEDGLIVFALPAAEVVS